MRQLFKYVALLLAANYFGFQVELFENEYEQNHRPVSQTSSIGSPTVNWETFDKSNAPKAFVFNAEVAIQLLHLASVPSIPLYHHLVDDDLIRDKSPPSAFLAS